MPPAAAASAADPLPPKPKKDKNKYRKDKPWDHAGIDHWAVEPFKPEQAAGPLVEESSFATLFPQYREKYLRDVWPLVKRAMEPYGVAAKLDLVEGSMTVSTTRKTFDPFIIIKARDVLKLLARSVPLQQAAKALQDGTDTDVIKLGGLVANKERFVKRRARLLGPNGSTLKAIELLTNCYMLVQGNTVAAMGPFQGLKQLRKIVEDCLTNTAHPIYAIKALMIKRELAKDPALAEESWDRFLPKFKKKSVKKKAAPTAAADAAKKAAKKAARAAEAGGSVFPPLPPPSKVDMQLESGEYFLSERAKKERRAEEREAKAAVKKAEAATRRAAAYVPPPAAESAKDKATAAAAKRKREEEGPSLAELTDKAKRRGKRRKA